MPTRDNIRNVALPLVMAIIVVAVVFPTCQMVGCSMPGGAMPFFGHVTGTALSSPCGGTYVTNDNPLGIVPSTTDALTLALAVAVIGFMAFALPPRRDEPVCVEVIEPPPLPDVTDGTNLRI